MPETITIAGKTYPKSLTYILAAAGAGVVAYAWWTRSSSATSGEGEAQYLVPEEPTGVLPFGGTVSGTFSEGPVAYRNDQEWYNDARSKLALDYGVADTATASDALDRYLANRPLTAAQVPMINFVINSIGPPPSGARAVRQETVVGPPPTGGPSGPSPVLRGLSIGVSDIAPDRIRWEWNQVENATYYIVQPVKVSQGNC